MGVGEHRVDGDTFSGGRRLGRWWRTPVGAANSELKRGVRRMDVLESYWQRIEADRRGPPVRFKKLAGARRLRWTPASNHGESGRSEVTKSFSVSFRVGGWWTWASGSTASMATLSPADGGSGDGGELRWVLQTPN